MNLEIQRGNYIEPPLVPESKPYEEEMLAQGIADKEEAEDFLREMVENGFRPVISVPKEFLEHVLKAGKLSAKETWIPGFSALVGTIGVEPYQGNDRVLFEVDNTEVHFSPRFTGKDKKFHGIVYFNQNEIPLDDLKRLN